MEFMYLGFRKSAGGGREAAVPVRTRYKFAKFGKCCELLNGMKIPLMVKRTVYKSYVGPSNLYGSEKLRLKKSKV